MQDISVIPAWQRAVLVAQLQKTPLQQKTLRQKLDKLYQISSYNELEYVGEVLEAYAWMRLANDEPNFSRLFAGEKCEKWFYEEFVPIAIRYMVICKRFTHLVMMVLTQQLMVEALRIYAKIFDHLDKYPKANAILRNVFEFEKQFFKVNYVCETPLLHPLPTTQQASAADVFAMGLKVGDAVDVLRVDAHSRRFCWLPGKVKKVTNLSLYVQPQCDRSSYSLDKKGLLVFPHGSRSHLYEWRLNLQAGDKVDLLDQSACWRSATVAERRQTDEQKDVVEILLEWGDRSDWFSLTDPKIQQHGVFTSHPEWLIPRSPAENFLDDFDDPLVDPNLDSVAVVRPEYSRSTLLVQLIDLAHRELNLLNRCLEAVQSRKFGIEATADLVACVSQIQPFLHRNFAMDYLSRLVDALLAYVRTADELTIRNFSKERFELVSSALNEFLKRTRPMSERKVLAEELQLSLTLRFLQSDFLDRKLYAVSVLTTMLKHSKHRILKHSTEELLAWVREKAVLPCIFHEKAHSELIARSAEFLQWYLLSQPDPNELTPLLEWSEPILKLLNECYEYLPEEFKETLVGRIKERANVTNKDALDIVKRGVGCEAWLLANGGESWVSVVKEKVKRRADIVEVFGCPFPVVDKITREVSELYECKFKNEYFLQLHEANYLPRILSDDKYPLSQRLGFAALTIDPLVQIKDELFNALAPFTNRIDELPTEAQGFFVAILPKITNKNVGQLFRENFAGEQLELLGTGGFAFFRACFLRVNEEQKTLERKVTLAYPTPHAAKKERRETLTIKANPNQLAGMEQLMTIVFGSKDLRVTQAALEFIGFLFDHLAPELAASVVDFRGAFLQNCLTQLYAASGQQQKYLRIIEGLLDESQKDGIDVEPSVSALFLTQTLSLRVVDHFNVNKGRLLLEAPASLTLHELRAQIARHLNAFPHELRLSLNDKELDPRLSGRVIHTLGLTAGELVAERKGTVEKVGLCETDGSLNEKCKKVLRGMFREYSQGGLMGKAQCQKFHQRCVGEVSSMSESKVDKIYDTYDTDKDGYLTEANFLSFYEFSAKARESAVWSNLETFGIRNDLEDLRDLPIAYPLSHSLTRHLLFANAPFMSLLMRLLQSPDDRIAAAAWRVASRLPLLSQQIFFSLELDISKPLLFRYWLYEVVSAEKWELLAREVLERLLSADIETACIGLRAAIHSPHFEVETFSRILGNLKRLNAQNQLSFHSQVVLDNTLKILEWLLRENEAIRQHYAVRHAEYDPILTAGLMAKNPLTRRAYSAAVETIIEESADEHFDIFEPFFRLVYGNFEKCDKSTLSLEYFELYSKLLEVLKLHPELLQKLSLNWLILTRSMIALFLAHRSTETGLNSPPDQVAQGFLRILRKLLDPSTVQEHLPLVRFLFQQSLFPESGQNKLKNGRSRKEAYELLYEICAVGENSPGLRELFGAGFKNVYKKMSASKATSSYGFSSYFYSYNEARSELGYAGIRNLGCICYMIAMLQQLFMTQSFRSLLLMADDGAAPCLARKGGKEVDDNLLHQLQNMFANLELTERQDYNPDEFCFSFKDFEGMPVNVSVQQDAQEFLNLFFDKLETALKPTPFRRILEDAFGGKTCNQTVCSNCKAVNERLENFYPLSLQVKGYRSIEQSLRKFVQGEVISDYQCDACKKKTDVTKSCLLAKLPNYLIVHLQRMCFNYDKFENEKVNTRWEFPNALNLYPYSLDRQKGQGTAEDYAFTLKGVVLHYGSADFGHYFSYIKENDSKWIEFNDERVREFDPHDIESDCFGGEHWRRESQSAYLLVYEKVAKTPLHLEFGDQQEAQQYLIGRGLQEAVFQAETEEKPQTEQEQEQESEDKIEEKIEEKTEGEKSETESVVSEPVPKQEQKFLVSLHPERIPLFVPQTLRDKISKANEEFSFTLNLSNDEFAHFLHKILSIDPPADLTTEFLELCYECFHLRTLLEDQDGVTLSEWAAKRFREIIGGHGWQFLKAFGQNWESDILSVQRNTRIGIKNLLQCVIADIIRSSQTEPDPSQKVQLVNRFLQTYAEMLSNQVGKNWTRFREYFQVWTGLIGESAEVREWCRSKRMVERLLDFILEEYSPFSKGHKKYTLRNMHYGAEFELPLEVVTLLLKEGYELTEAERQCMRHYAFLEKAIKYPTAHYNLVDYLCREDRLISEKTAYLLLFEISKVTQSDEVKPFIASLLRFLEIKDEMCQLRVDWLFGFPQWAENLRTGSYGVFGINPEQDVLLNYVSAVRASPLTQQLVKFKNKAQHVASLLLTLMLQLEADGYLHNLDQLPSLFAFTQPYTFWFQEFVDSYYEDTHRSFIAKHYTDYGDRLKALWLGRPHRPFPAHPQYLVGRTLSRTTIREVQVSDVLELEYIDVTSHVLPQNEQNAFLTKRNIKNFPGSEDFKVKLTTTYGGHSFMTHDRERSYSSDEEEPQQKPNPFDKTQKLVLFRKIVLRNLSYDNLVVVAELRSASPQPNYTPCNLEMSFDVKGESTYTLTVAKIDAEEEFGECQLEVKSVTRAAREGYWPRQIITVVEEREEDRENSDNEMEESSSNTWVL